jgi:signal transduction histidine kinase
MSALIFIVLLLTLTIGGGVLWANPRRIVNRVFSLFSFTSASWLFCVYTSSKIGSQFAATQVGDPVPWIRGASAVGAFFPWIIWLMKESILADDASLRRIVRKSWPWLLLAIFLGTICFTDLFIPADSTPTAPKRGVGYTLYSVLSFSAYIVLVVGALFRIKRAVGIRRLELQILIINFGLMCLATLALTVVASILDLRFISRLSPIVVLIFYALTAWNVTFRRVFDARQIFLSIAQKLTLATTLCGSILIIARLAEQVIPSSAAIIVSVTFCSFSAFWLERKSRLFFGISAEQKIASTRRTIIDLARSEPSPDKLVVKFEDLLREWGQTTYARLLFDSGEIYAAGDLEFAKDRPAHAALCKDGWTTPESLQRQRAEAGLVDLRQFVTESNLALLVTAPRGSSSPSLLVALGTKVNHRPFTYPEVQQLQEIAEFMDNILARSRLTMQARQSEQLATIGLLGASLAHEIRNPLVSIKTFAHLLPTRFDDPEFRRRFNLLIPGEVDRIDSLTQQLLDLSNPRRHQMELMPLHITVRETVDLMLTRATEAHISISSTLTAAKDTILADHNAIRQVLINLFINAIQALEMQETDRRIEIRSRNSPNGSVILEVSDNGPGIPPEQRAKLFHPFASTKTTGMGLGLAVCSDILHEHRATIIVPDTGRPGATFRITFPCPPLSS